MYTFNTLLDELPVWQDGGAIVTYIGSTVLGRMIPAVHLGPFDAPQVIIQAAIHAREYLTAELVSRQIFAALNDSQALQCGFWFVPMVNIDGVSLAQFGLDSVRDAAARDFLIDVNGGEEDFALWKANAAAVDLNCNFSARWGTGAGNLTYPAPSSYIGPYPDSEPETQALLMLTHEVTPVLTVSYHAKGQILFWDFYQEGEDRIRDRAIAQQISDLTTYTVIDGTLGSAGGYKDYCVEHLAIPAYTVEIIDEGYQYPLPQSALQADWILNAGMVGLLDGIAAKL